MSEPLGWRQYLLGRADEFQSAVGGLSPGYRKMNKNALYQCLRKARAARPDAGPLCDLMSEARYESASPRRRPSRVAALRGQASGAGVLLLDLCCGYGSMRAAARKHGWLYLGVDVDPEVAPDDLGPDERFVNLNINSVSTESLLESVAEALGVEAWGSVKTVRVHASPPCQFSSNARIRAPRDADHRGMLLTVVSCLKAMVELDRRGMLTAFSMENPESYKEWSMWKHELLRPLLPHTEVVDYCAYGAPYKKPTRFVVRGLRPLRCQHKGPHAAQVHTQPMRTKFSIPERLCLAVADAAPTFRDTEELVKACKRVIGEASRFCLDGPSGDVVQVGEVLRASVDMEGTDIVCQVRRQPPWDNVAHDMWLPYSEVADTAAWDRFEVSAGWKEFLEEPETQECLARRDCAVQSEVDGASGLLVPRRIGLAESECSDREVIDLSEHEPEPETGFQRLVNRAEAAEAEVAELKRKVQELTGANKRLRRMVEAAMA